MLGFLMYVINLRCNATTVIARCTCPVCGEQDAFRDLLRKGDLDRRTVKIDTPGASRHPISSVEGFQGFLAVMITVGDGLSRNQRGEKREMTIAEARPLVEAQEEERLINNDTVHAF